MSNAPYRTVEAQVEGDPFADHIFPVTRVGKVTKGEIDDDGLQIRVWENRPKPPRPDGRWQPEICALWVTLLVDSKHVAEMPSLVGRRVRVTFELLDD